MASLLSSLSLLLVVVVAGASALPANSSKPIHPEPRVQFDSNCRCGQKAAARIVGGQVTGVNEYPWMAGLFYFNQQQFCGGSLINDRYVLTAAHCTVDFRAAEITVRLAEHDLRTNSESTVITRSVAQIINHPNYQAGTERNDIALLKLSSPVDVSSTVMPVCMPPPLPKYGGKRATVTGWGTLSSGGSSSNVLREVEVNVLSNNACLESYGSGNIISSMICASDAGRDSCQGDSGGPLVFKDAGNNYDQIGVVSWGIGCAQAEYPGVYTRVNSYLDWIRSNTEDGIYCKGMNL
ncbi:trypsin alpha-3-like [Eriocheir sinensis]|uniref:trypsin alpha-3-like n=1 Tax=Eriocheir sinensis TaxID=95602 RepID=UPI0021C604B0|nr:trypsin alpha-3-like [Eriocheir sinensis]